MTTFKAIAALVLTTSAIHASPAYAASAVAGKWDIVAEAQGMQFKSTLTIAEAPGGYTVEIVDVPSDGGFPPMQGTISDVSVNGSEITFKRNITGDFALTLNYKLTATGDTLAGEASSDFGPSTVKGTRAK